MMDLIAPGRRTLADILGGLSDAQWRAPSLCAGWTVAHVVAHVTMPFRVSGPEFMRGVQEAGGFTQFSDAVAERDSRLPRSDLVAALRDNAGTPWSPPGGGLAGALCHDVVHGLDITWPLGVKYPVADRAMTTVLDLVVSGDGGSLFGVPLDGIELRAGDLDWSHGTGAPLTGPAQELLLLIAGRAVPHDLFTGPGVDLLAGDRT
jgi:uncharacterized protein (TIGR03083 family)